MSTADADPAPPQRRAILAAVIGLGLTSLIGWGTTFNPLQVLGQRIGADIGVAPELIYAGITIMMLTSAVLAPLVGRRIDSHGARTILVLGSLIMAAGMSLVALADGFAAFALGWLVIGIAVPLALTSAAVPALVQIAGARSRRAVTALTIVTGITSTIFMPLSAWLEARFGWRIVFLIFGALHLFVCLPVHLLVLPRGRPARRPGQDASGDATWEGLLPEGRRRIAFLLIALWTSVESLVVWGFNMQAINIFVALGLTQGAAIAAWMLSGPSQACIRAGELFSGSRHSIFAIAIISGLLPPIGFAVFLWAGASAATAALLAVLFGSGLGLYSIARQIIPLRLFGVGQFGHISGRLTLPQNVATAIAPLLFAWLLSRAGPILAVTLALSFALVALAALLLLVKVARTSGRD